MRPRFARWRLLIPLIAACPVVSATAAAPPKAAASAPLDAWLGRQTNLLSWQAQVTQIRSLQSLQQPLTNTGRVWFQAPNRFRWELGTPAKTIATRDGDALLLLYPALQRAEIYPLGPAARGPWRDSLALLEAGFPRSASDLEARFQILAVATNAHNLEITLRPRSPGARRWMSQILVRLARTDLSLEATELAFADGSRLRNEFSQPIRNPQLDPELFRPGLPPNYTVTKPAER